MRFATVLLWVALASGAAPATAGTGRNVPVGQDGVDVVVVASDEPPGDWRRVDSDHVTLYGHGPEAELRRVNRGLEALHALMTRLYLRTPVALPPRKPTIFLVDSAEQFRTIGFDERRAPEGPFSASYSARRYYHPAEDGAVIAIARSDQIVEQNTNRRFNDDCDTYHAGGGMGFCDGNVPVYPPVVRTWEAVLYATYAQHFLLTYLPAAYPRWYVDGVGALFSTMRLRRDGVADYALPPDGYRGIFQSYGYPDVAAVLNGTYLVQPWNETRWSPYAAWLMTHFFVFADIPTARRAQFAAYMAAIARGTPPARAALVFGDVKLLTREIMAHARRPASYALTATPASPPAEPLVTRLTKSGDARINAQLAIEARRGATVDLPTGASDTISTTPAGDDASPDTLALRAEAACRAGLASACLRWADLALSQAPDHVRALTWRAVAEVDLAIGRPGHMVSARLEQARRDIRRAQAIDAGAPLPHLAYYRSFEQAGEPAPPDAIAGLAAVIQAVPAAPAPRLYLGRELLRHGNADLARRVLNPVAYGAYDTPEKTAAIALLAPAP